MSEGMDIQTQSQILASFDGDADIAVVDDFDMQASFQFRVFAAQK